MSGLRNFVEQSSVGTTLEDATNAVNNNRNKISQTLGPAINKQLPIIFAIRNHSHNLVYALLKAGADINRALSEAQRVNDGSLTDQYIINILQNRTASIEATRRKADADNAASELTIVEAIAATVTDKKKVADAAAADEATKGDAFAAAKAAFDSAKAEFDSAAVAAKTAKAVADDAEYSASLVDSLKATAAAKAAAAVITPGFAAAIAADNNLAPYNTTASGPSASGPFASDPSASGPSAPSSGGARKYKSRKSKRSRKLKRRTR
jgi:hypothetical protein